MIDVHFFVKLQFCVWRLCHFPFQSTLSSLASSFHESDSGAEAASEDNSEEGGMEIIEVDPDLDIFDRQLRRKSEEVKLTATNVKSILRVSVW